MKVLHITNAFPYDGYSSYGIFIKEQIDSLSKVGLINEVVFINSHKFGFLYYFKSSIRVFRIFKVFNPDIIHCHHEFSLISCLPIILSRKIPLVLSLLGDISKRSFLNRFFYKCVKSIPNATIYKAAKYEESSNFFYLPNGVNVELFRPIQKEEAKLKLNLDLNKKYILFVTASLNNPIKRYDRFLNILSELKKWDVNVEELIMSGIKRELTPFYFNAADLFLLTSDHEGSPNAIKEAMCCNIPIVSTDVGNVSLLFQNTNGLFVNNSEDYDGLVLSSKKAILFNHSNGRDAILSLGLDMDSVAKEICKIYQKLII